MASLKAVLETLDDVPEALHELYIEPVNKDDKFILSLDGIDQHPAVTGLKTALEKQKAERRKLFDEVKVLKERLANVPEDFNPDEFSRLRTLVEEYESGDKGGHGEKAAQEAVAARKMLEQKIATMEKNHITEVDKLKKQITHKDEFIGELLIDDGLTKALIDSGVGKEYMKAAKALLRQDVKVQEEDGKYIAIVETDTGVLDVPKYVSDWVASDEGKVFVPPAKGGDAGGSGKPSPRLPNSEPNPWAKDTWNMTQQGMLLKTDRAKAEKFAKVAGHKIPTLEA